MLENEFSNHFGVISLFLFLLRYVFSSLFLCFVFGLYVVIGHL